jgi:hypothetical protein
MQHNQIQPKQTLSFSALQMGLPRGALTEISGTHGSGKTEVVLNFLAENPETKIAWIEDQFTIFPTAFTQNQVSLERVLFVEAHPEKELFWITQQVLKSQIFEIIVLCTFRSFNETSLRRLQLASEKAMAVLIILVETPALQGSWPILVQLKVSRTPTQPHTPQIQILKYRGLETPSERRLDGKSCSLSAL